MRVHRFLFVLLCVPSLATAAGSCEVDEGPQEQYACDCEVTCDGSASLWMSLVCSDAGDQTVAESVASANCRHVHRQPEGGSCDDVTCTCTCTTSGDTEACK